MQIIEKIKRYLRKTDRTPLILAVILLLALLLRLPYADGRSSYAYQELIRDLGVVRSIDAGETVLSGPPSAHGEFHFGPMYYYILYPAAKLLDFAPYSLAISSLIASLLTIFLVYRLTLLWWNDRRVSLMAAGLLALSFLDIQFAKYASNPNFVPLFTVTLVYYLTTLSDRESGRWRALAAGFCLGAGMQLHAVPLLALPLLVLLAVVSRRDMITPWRAVSFIAGLSTALLPYALYEISTGFANLASLLAIGSGEPVGTYYGIILDNVSFWISTVVSSHRFFSTILLMGPWLLPMAVLLAVPAYLLFRRELHRMRRVRTPAAGPKLPRLMIFAWLISFGGVLFLPITSVSYLRIYYFTGLIPLAYILLAAALTRLHDSGLRLTAIYLFLVYCALQIAQLPLYYAVVSSLKIPA